MNALEHEFERGLYTMINGAVKNAQEKMVYRKEDITLFCKIELGKEIEWCYNGQLGPIIDRNLGYVKWIKGKVVADYEHYIICQSEKGYRYCLEKNDIAIKSILIKGFEPKVPKISCFECERLS